MRTRVTPRPQPSSTDGNHTDGHKHTWGLRTVQEHSDGQADSFLLSQVAWYQFKLCASTFQAHSFTIKHHSIILLLFSYCLMIHANINTHVELNVCTISVFTCLFLLLLVVTRISLVLRALAKPHCCCLHLQFTTDTFTWNCKQTQSCSLSQSQRYQK